jgi:hypothetical protein
VNAVLHDVQTRANEGVTTVDFDRTVGQVISLSVESQMLR